MDPIFEKNLSASRMGTGSLSVLPSSAPRRVLVIDFDQYEVVLAVTEDNRVLGVLEVRVKKDFRNMQQRLGSIGYIDMDQFDKK